MNSAKLHISFPLANGTTAGIHADVSCAWLLDILRETHQMRPDAGEHLLAEIMPLKSGEKHQYFPSSKRIQVDLPQNDIPKIYLGTMPENHEQRIKLARGVMFIALLPMLKKQELFLFHGGLTVDSNGKGCILCGPSGVGKSTAVKKAGNIWEILSDDLIYLSFQNGKCFAMPGPTWSSYLLEKERPVNCDINRIIEVKNTVVLSRIGELGIHKLAATQAGLMIADSFIEMTTWLAGFLRDEQLSVELRRNAFDGVMSMPQNTACYRLTSELETDITPFLRSIEQ